MCKPVTSHKEVIVGVEYLVIQLVQNCLIPEIIRITHKPRKVGNSKLFRYISPKKKTEKKPEEKSRHLSDINIDGGGYNRHHLFRMTPKNYQFMMNLVLAQDSDEYRRLF